MFYSKWISTSFPQQRCRESVIWNSSSNAATDASQLLGIWRRTSARVAGKIPSLVSHALRTLMANSKCTSRKICSGIIEETDSVSPSLCMAAQTESGKAVEAKVDGEQTSSLPRTRRSIRRLLWSRKGYTGESEISWMKITYRVLWQESAWSMAVKSG